MRRLLSLAAIVTLLIGLDRGAAWGEGISLSRWEFRTGYAYQYKNNARPNNFQVISVLPSAVVPLTDEWGPAWLRGRIEWNPELFLAAFIHPYTRPLVGVTPLQFRYVLQTRHRFKPYLFGGAGVLYANINRRETRKDLNFNPQGGAGVYYAFHENTSLILEYRHIHISNAGLHEDNAGVNTHTFLAGVSIKR